MLYSESAHGAMSSGFFFEGDINAPGDAFLVDDADVNTAINLSDGFKYSFSPPVDIDGVGALVVVKPSSDVFLNIARSAQILVLEAAYQAEISKNVAYLGTSFQADSSSFQLIANYLAVGSVAPNFWWLDVNNVQVSFSFKQFQELGAAIAGRNQSAFARLQLLKNKVRGASSREAVEAVVW